MWLTVTLTDGTKITYSSPQRTLTAYMKSLSTKRFAIVGEFVAFSIEHIVSVTHSSNEEMPQDGASVRVMSPGQCDDGERYESLADSVYRWNLHAGIHEERRG